MTEASSRPTRPKQITPKEFRTKRGLAGMRKSAVVTDAPKRSQNTLPKTMRTRAAIKGSMAPGLLGQLPTLKTKTVTRPGRKKKNQGNGKGKEFFLAKESCPASR